MRKCIYPDTEDDSKELMERDLSGFDKCIVQIACLDHQNGRHLWEIKRGTKLASPERRKESNRIIAEFVTWLLEISGDEEVYAYWANSQYDMGAFFADYLDQINIEKMVGSRLIRARYKNIIWLDVFNIWQGTSVAGIGETVGLPKLPFDTVGSKYVFRDCEIVRKGMQIAFDFAREHGVEKFPATIGGLGTKIWQAMGGENWQCGSMFAREAYFGGRVELFSGGGTGNIFYTDVSSLYPSCLTLPYPTEYHRMNDWQTGYGVARVRIEVPECEIAPLPVRMEDGSVFYPYGTFDGVWTFHEIQNAVKHGAKVLTFHEAYGSEMGAYYYRDFIEKMYALRRFETDPGKKTFLKFVMNAFYGQLGCTGRITRSLLLDACIARDEYGDIIYDEAGEALMKVAGTPYGQKLLAEIDMPIPEHANYLHAAMVTSYGRVTLQDHFRMVPYKDLIYGDTDGMLFFAKVCPFPLGSELGQMKLEEMFTRASVHAPKMYETTNEQGKTSYKAKGVPSRLKELDSKRLAGAMRKYDKRLALMPEIDASKMRRKLESEEIERLGLVKLPQEFIQKKTATYSIPYRLRESIIGFNNMKQNGKNKPRKLSVWRKVTKFNNVNYQRKDYVDGHFIPKHYVTDPSKNILHTGEDNSCTDENILLNLLCPK